MGIQPQDPVPFSNLTPSHSAEGISQSKEGAKNDSSRADLLAQLSILLMASTVTSGKVAKTKSEELEASVNKQVELNQKLSEMGFRDTPAPKKKESHGIESTENQQEIMEVQTQNKLVQMQRQHVNEVLSLYTQSANIVETQADSASSSSVQARKQFSETTDVTQKITKKAMNRRG